MAGPGTAPTATLLWLVGNDNVEALFTYLGRGHHAAEEWWPQVRRVYEYYLEEDWARFNKASRELLDDQWWDPSTTHERATAAHQAIGIVLKAFVNDEHPASAMFLGRWLRKHASALKHASYREFTRNEGDSGAVTLLQRRLFDVLDLFVRRFESWQMGMLLRMIPEENLPLLKDLRLFRDEFDIVRDLYQQGFETVCKVLQYPVAVQNTIKRGHPNDFGSVVPATLTRKINPKSIHVFNEKLSNFEKLQYVAQVPGWADWTGFLDNRTRNAIGHGTARHDLRTGLVISDNEPGGVPYLDVIADVYGVFDALCAALQVLRSIRVVSSPDFEREVEAGHAAAGVSPIPYPIGRPGPTRFAG